VEAIRAADLCRRFGDTVAVDRLSLSIGEGELFGLVGSDGAGKTTTLRMLAGVLDPTGGEAFVLGRPVKSEAPAIHREIGYMPQRFGLYPDLTVSENIGFYAELYGVPRREREGRIPGLLDFSGLGPFVDRRAGDLSGGMKQKLGLCCALVHTPKALLLDEPTNGVDPVSRRDFWRILYRLVRERVTVLVSTAYLDEAERFGRLAFLHEGRLLALGTPDDLKGGIRGTVVELPCGSPRQAADRLREAFGPSSPVGILGDRIRIAAGEGEGARERAERALSDAGLAHGPAAEVDPTLEDVFVSMLATRGGGAA
jgi:ABC-2 type transport system ATP-binding protein